MSYTQYYEEVVMPHYRRENESQEARENPSTSYSASRPGPPSPPKHRITNYNPETGAREYEYVYDHMDPALRALEFTPMELERAGKIMDKREKRRKSLAGRVTRGFDRFKSKARNIFHDSDSD
ncbi:MAG TPA: hypothetical protein VFP68_01855 [Burkholderiaceae bacterium]|nr:hypothetical protein [Burkholderiaceae bacterium]